MAKKKVAKCREVGAVQALVKALPTTKLALKMIKSDSEYVKRVAQLVEYKGALKRLKEESEDIIVDAKSIISKVRAQAKPAKVALETNISALRHVIDSYDEKQRQKALKAAEKEASKVEDEAPDFAEDIRSRAAASPATPPVAGARRMETLSYEVEDFGQLPEEFKTVDKGKLWNAVKKAAADGVEIAGVKIIKKRTLAVS